jgi:hypothetical protein
MSFWSRLVQVCGAALSRRKNALNRSKLIGMYLQQANSGDSLAVDYQRTRQRRNGKYSHNRER